MRKELFADICLAAVVSALILVFTLVVLNKGPDCPDMPVVGRISDYVLYGHGDERNFTLTCDVMLEDGSIVYVSEDWVCALVNNTACLRQHSGGYSVCEC